MPPTRSGPPTEQEILKIARRTTDIIESNITNNVCLFGSAASFLWADIGRVPNDIDVVVSEDDFEEFDAEDIKEMIVQADDRYYLEGSKKLGASHQILYCRLPGWASDEMRRIKVDILVPPTLNLPAISWSYTHHIGNIPVMPIFDLLVMKAQGWRDHRYSRRKDFRDKEPADVNDIFALLESAKQMDVSYVNEANEDRHTPEFMSHAAALARKFVSIYGRPRPWRALGFPV